jgi:hypothetical protein
MALPRRYGYIMCALAFAHDFVLYFVYWISYSIDNEANFAQNGTQVVCYMCAYPMLCTLLERAQVCWFPPSDGDNVQVKNYVDEK